MKFQMDSQASFSSSEPGPAVLQVGSVRKPGFALVVTLTLMILLTIVAVGLLTLSSISLRQTQAASAMAMAQNNARLALVLALGELQTQAGPDQRVTGIADIAGTATGDAIAAGAVAANLKSVNDIDKGLSSVQPGTRYWTGVWKNSATNPATEIYTVTPSPVLTKWLISGNESRTLASLINPATQAYAVNSNGEPADPATTALLVGRNTIGLPSAETIQRYVTAPLVPIRVGNEPPTGRYAWWIGDEGVKARIDMRRTHADPNQSASLLAQRRGWETVTDMATYPAPGTPGEAALPNALTTAQVPLLGISRNAAQQIFHASTSDSRGVIADPLNGGTRIDLTTLLQSDLPSSSPIPTILNYPTLTGTIVPRTAARTMIAPKWSALKQFYDQSAALEGGALIVRAATFETTRTSYLTNPNVVGGVANAAIAPLVTDFRILMGVRFVSQGATSVKANPCGKIAIAIANPYSVPLKWNQDLEFHVKNQTPPGNRPSRIWNLGAETAYFNDSNNTSEPAVFNNAYFRIRADTLQPGEVRAYTHSGATLRNRLNSRITVDLAPFGSSSPGNFANCIEMETTTNRTTLPGMDVRESWQTTLIGLEMRLGGGSSNAGLLRSIDRFDLDNGYFSPNTRRVSITDAQTMRSPVPLMLYSFSLSQPGMDYLSLMPGGYDLGQRGSTLRTFMDFNLQASRFYKPIASYNPPPYFMECTNSISQLPEQGEVSAFTRDLAIPRWGYSAKTGPGRAILFDIPDSFVSLAQLQHADLTGDDLSASIAHQPAYAVGNSYANPFVKRSLTFQSRFDYEIIGSPNTSGAINSPRNYYDLSYLLNASLWDSFFFSSLAGSGTSKLPQNPTLIFHQNASAARLSKPEDPAAALMIDGSFNINSTSKDAWKAFLASGRHFKHRADSSDNPAAAFPRSLRQSSSAAVPASGTDDDSYTGFRRLSDAQIDALAEEIVKQVRLRGPFVSVSHFVNRAIGELDPPRPTAATANNRILTRAGALQVAIDESGININAAGNRSGFAKLTGTRDAVKLAEKNGAPRADMDGGDTANQLPNADSSIKDWAVTSTDNNFGSVASILADRSMMSNPRMQAEQGYRSTAIPGWLTQADVLQAIGPSISARSDTFRIRTCGEALDPSGKVIATAYCEAIVQRIPDYVDSANAPTDRVNQLNALNTLHGRKFQIVSFRWLSPREI